MKHAGLFLLCLDHDWFAANKGRIRASFFAEELQPLFESVKQAHENYHRSVTIDEVVALHLAQHPSITTARKTVLMEAVYDIKNEKPFGRDVANDLLHAIWTEEIGRQVAEAALVMATEGKDNISEIRRIIEKAEGGLVPSDGVDFGPDDPLEALQSFEDREGWGFNLRTLTRRVGVISRGDFWIVGGRPDSGKTAFPISLAMAPGGWCHQGANVHILGNEEIVEKHRIRAMCAATGMTFEEIKADKTKVKQLEHTVWPKLRVFNGLQYARTFDEMDAYLKRYRPDIFVIDQLDKVIMPGTYQRQDQALSDLYARTRDLAKIHDCAVIALSQLSADAEGKTQLDQSMFAGSKTGKAAEADLMIGIGRSQCNDEDDPAFNNRYINLLKNKITGRRGNEIVVLDGARSTFHD